MAAQEEELRRNIAELVQSNPELQALGLKLAELQKRQPPGKN